MRQTFLLLAAAVLVAGLQQDASAAPKAKPKPKAAAAQPEHDPLTEWELINGAAMEARAALKKARKPEPLRQQIAELAVRSAVGAERALAIGDASLFDSYRTQFREQFNDMRWRIGRMAEQGGGAAEFALGVLAVHGFFAVGAVGAGTVEAACRHFGAALTKGYAGAKFRLSQCLEKDDPTRAARLYLQAARAGDASAQNNAGELFETGRGVKADPKQALDWYRKAAEAGFVPGQFNLGRLYAAGTGVPRDFAEARKWLELAERGGIATARQLLDWMERKEAHK